jgi:hypothetical protein
MRGGNWKNVAKLGKLARKKMRAISARKQKIITCDQLKFSRGVFKRENFREKF